MATHPPQPSDDTFDDRELTAALAQKPDVRVAAGFAARVALEAAAAPVRVSARPIRWGRWAAYLAAPTMLLLMLHFSAQPADLASTIVQGTLCVQFLLLVVALTQFRQLFGD